MCLYETGRNALTAVLDLAAHEQDGPVGLPGICERTGLGLPCLEEIFRKLLDHGIVAMTSGTDCGYQLLQTPEELTAAEIILAVEDGGTGNALGCGTSPRRMPSRDFAQLAAETLWSGLDASLIGYLSTVTIRDMTGCTAAGPCRAWMH